MRASDRIIPPSDTREIPKRCAQGLAEWERDSARGDLERRAGKSLQRHGVVKVAAKSGDCEPNALFIQVI